MAILVPVDRSQGRWEILIYEAYEGGRVTGKGGHLLVEAGYLEQVSRYEGTWGRYLFSPGTYPGPRQGCMAKLGPPLGLGTE